MAVNSLSNAPPSPPPSQQASQELSEVLNQIWDLDANRLRPGTDYVISLQVRHESLKLSHMMQICNACNGIFCSKKKSVMQKHRQFQGHTTALVI